MMGPAADETPLASRGSSLAPYGYAIDPGGTVQLRCRPPGAANWTVISSVSASATPENWWGSDLYPWSSSVVVPELCWTPAGPGVAAANFGAYYPSEGMEVHRMSSLPCLYRAGSVLMALTCSDFPSWTRLVAPSDLPPGGDPLAGAGPLTVVASGLSFAEGPSWDSAQGHLRFSDIETDTLWSEVPGNAPVALDSGGGTHLNGQSWFPGGDPIRCEHATQRVMQGDPPGVVVADSYGGQPLNSPNDAVVAPDGTIYFTDPTYGSFPQWGGASPVLGFRGLYRVAKGEVILEHSWTDRQPNGVVLAPGGDTLYVSDTENGEILAIPVLSDGALGPEAHFGWVTGADGMAIDVDGNLFVPSENAVEVLAPNGSSWGSIPGISQGTNAAFGGPDRTTLFVTTRSTVYSVELTIPGVPDAR